MHGLLTPLVALMLSAAQPVVVGVMVSNQNDPNGRLIHAVFTAQNGKWTAPDRVDVDDKNPRWRVMLNGAERTRMAWATGKYTGDASKLPAVKNNNQFSGAGVYRPLLLLANTGQPTLKELKNNLPAPTADLFPAFLAYASSKNWCVADSPQKADLKENDLRVVSATRLPNGMELFAVTPRVTYFECDSPRDAYVGPSMFALIKKDIVRLGESLQLIEAGDFDGDGKVEYVFWDAKESECDNQYILFADNMHTRIAATRSVCNE